MLGQAEARGQMTVRAFERGNRTAQPLGKAQRAGKSIAGQHREFLAADPAHTVAARGLLEQNLGDLAQRKVAHRMTEPVVERLEIVDVEKNRAGLAAAR